MPATLHIRLLGEFRLVSGATLLTTVFAPRLQALLAYLVLHRGAPQPRQHLAFLLWPDSTEAQARTNLRKQVYQLRRNLPEIDALLADEGATLYWRPDAPFTLDVAEFERSAASARPAAAPGDQTAVRANLEHALSLYGGPLLPGCYDDWILPERERLHQMYLDAAEQLIQILESQADYRQAISYAQRLLRHDPLHEVTYRHLMRLYALSGDRIGALRVYRTCETVLQRELGVEPSAATREVYERMVKTEASPRPSTISQAAPAVEKKHNLPLQLTSFIGRERELAEVEHLLATTRLLTLTGAGGSGKTRLALQVAHRLAHVDRFADGVWWVELAALSDPALAAQAVASALRLHDRPDQSLNETLSDYLRARRVLLLLDNCEHLVDACAQLSERLLRTCPNLQILATSREGLGVAGETTWLVPGLSVSARDQAQRAEDVMQSESARLFVERAAAALPTFRLTEQNAAAVAQVCQRLDGIPLAIELAATRVKLLGVEQLADRLTDSFLVLTAGSRTALPRHQTLQAAIDWSHDLLSAPEQAVWHRLSVFAGGFSLAAAETVCAGDGLDADDILELLSHLIDKSLVLVVEHENGGEISYRLLETIRQYGWQKLREAGEVATIQRQHAHFFLALVVQAEPHLWGENSATWLDRLDREHDNLRAALDYFVAQADEAESGLQMAGRLWRFWEIRSYFTEGRSWLEKALARREETPPASRWLALHGAGNLAVDLGNYETAKSYYAESLDLLRELDHQRGIALSLLNLGNLALMQGECEQAITFTEEALTIHRQLRNQIGISMAVNNLADMALHQSRYDQAETLSLESLAVFRELGDERGIGWAFRRLGTIAMYRCAYPQAAQFYQESKLAFQKLKNQADMIWLLFDLGELARQQGDNLQAAASYHECLALAQETGDRRAIAVSLNSLAVLAHQQGDDGQATTWCDRSIAIQRQIDNKYGLAESLHNRGHIAYDRREYAAARTYYQESLTLRQRLKEPRGVAYSLEALAALALAGAPGPERAVQLISAAAALREAIGAPLSPFDRIRSESTQAALRAVLNEETFASAWEEGQALTLEQAIADALQDSGSPDTDWK